MTDKERNIITRVIHPIGKEVLEVINDLDAKEIESFVNYSQENIKQALHNWKIINKSKGI